MGRAEDIFSEIVERGMNALEDFILNRKSEELFLDYKRSANDGQGETLDSGDWKNLSKAISGFGNSEGGVLIWGVSCGKVKGRGDIPDALHPVTDVRRFVSLLEGAVSGCTVPPHTGVRSHATISDGDDGFAVTLIPKSLNTPHQSIQNTQYYIRAGSSFAPTPHAVLQGMFGKRPQPYVYVMYTSSPAYTFGGSIIVNLGFLIGNSGPGIASDLFMNIKYSKIPGSICQVETEQRNPGLWYYGSVLSSLFTAISKQDLRIGPEQFVNPYILKLTLNPPFDKDLLIEGLCGCGQAPAWKFVLQNTRERVEQLYNEFLEMNIGGDAPREEGHRFVNKLFNISDELARSEDQVEMF